MAQCPFDLQFEGQTQLIIHNLIDSFQYYEVIMTMLASDFPNDFFRVNAYSSLVLAYQMPKWHNDSL